MFIIRRKNTYTAAKITTAAIAGLLIGGIAALLLTPTTGKQNRKKVKAVVDSALKSVKEYEGAGSKTFIDISKNVGNKFNEVKDVVLERYEDIKEGFSNSVIEEEINDHIAGKRKTVNVRVKK
jgi:gas vesicle protein